MRQVNEAELVWRVRYQLSRISAALRRDLCSRQADVRRMAEQQLAIQLVRAAFAHYEVLSSAPLPGNTDLFTAAAYAAGTGSAPTIDPDEPA